MAKTLAAKIDPSQIFLIVTLATSFAADVYANVVGKTGAALHTAIIRSISKALPVVEQITGKDLLNDYAVTAALEGLVGAFIDAPKRKAKK